MGATGSFGQGGTYGKEKAKSIRDGAHYKETVFSQYYHKDDRGVPCTDRYDRDIGRGILSGGEAYSHK